MGKASSKFTEADLAQETEFSEEEIKEWFKGFKADCPSGNVKLPQFKELFGKFFPNGDSGAFTEHIFRTFDKDGNGKIDFREFLCAMSVTSRGSVTDKLNWSFSMYDVDGDGYITEKEMLKLIQALYTMVGGMQNLPNSVGTTPEETATRVFSKLDSDSDGKVTREEFIAGTQNEPSIVKLLQGQMG